MPQNDTPRFCLNPKCRRLLKPYHQATWDNGYRSWVEAWYCEYCWKTYYRWHFDCQKAHRKTERLEASHV